MLLEIIFGDGWDGDGVTPLRRAQPQCLHGLTPMQAIRTDTPLMHSPDAQHSINKLLNAQHKYHSPTPTRCRLDALPYIYVERGAGIHPSQKSQKPREKSLDSEPPVSIWDRFSFGAGDRRLGVLPSTSRFMTQKPTQKPTLPPKKVTHLCRLCPKTTKILFRMILNSVDN